MDNRPGAIHSPMLRPMTPTPRPDAAVAREQDALRIYAEHPLDDGDALLLLDDTVCLELTGLADRWDEVGRRNLVQIIEASARRVLVAIARDRGRLLPCDYQLWRELHQDLRDTQVELLPVRALPAA